MEMVITINVRVDKFDRGMIVRSFLNTFKDLFDHHEADDDRLKNSLNIF